MRGDFMEKTEYAKFLELVKDLDEKSYAIVDCVTSALLAKQELDKQDKTKMHVEA